jgi:hypothetical protein
MITKQDESLFLEKFIAKYGKPSSGTYVTFSLNRYGNVIAEHMMEQDWGRNNLLRSVSMGNIDTLRRTWRDVDCPFCGAFRGYKCHNTKRRKYGNDGYIELSKPHKPRITASEAQP